MNIMLKFSKSIFIMAFVINLVTKCREGEFELDLEDIMIMEAIWLSIQVMFTTTWSGFYLTYIG